MTNKKTSGLKPGEKHLYLDNINLLKVKEKLLLLEVNLYPLLRNQVLDINL